MVKKRRLNDSASSSPSKTRIKEPRSPASGEELLFARDRFKGALMYLMNHSGDEDSNSSEDEERYEENQNPVPARKQKPPVKKKILEKTPEPEPSTFRQQFVMKLHDRIVNLSQFNENTPLYPICRAWISNEPYTPDKVKRSPSPEPKDVEITKPSDVDPEAETVKDVFKLPPPSPPVKRGQSLRIPKPVEYSSPFTKMMDQDGNDVPTRDQLLADNLNRWSKVRQKWLDASAANETRYHDSCQVLLNIFNRAQRTQY